MKHKIVTRIVIFVVLMLCGIIVLAQTGQDDQGHVNDPSINPQANACYPGGALAGACVTKDQWDCGWYLIRVEAGLLPSDSYQPVCATLFPNIMPSSQQNTSLYGQPTATPNIGDYYCDLSFATVPLPTLAQQAQTAIGGAGFSGISVTASEYVQSCMLDNDNTYFKPLYVTFDVSVTIGEGTNRDTVRQAVNTVIQGLSGLPTPNLRVNIQFVIGGPSITPTPTITATSTATYESCSWRWANQDRPELAQQAQAALNAAGVSNVSVTAWKHGEDCSINGVFQYFAAMDTNFDITVTVDVNANRNAIRQTIAAVIGSLSGIPTSQKYINVTFVIATPTPETPVVITQEVEVTEAVDVTPEAQVTEAVDLTPEATAETDPVITEPTVQPTATPHTGECTDNC